MITCLASMDTEHHLFEGVGGDEASAIEALERGLDAHAAQRGLPDGWWRGHYDIRTRWLNPAAAYRDGEPIQ